MSDIFRNRTNIAQPHANVLLTSSGITTKPMKEWVKDAIGTRRRRVQALVVTDGWRAFYRGEVSRSDRRMQYVDAAGARWWFHKWVDFGLNGQADLQYVRAGTLGKQEFGDRVSAADVTILPGGNTYCWQMGCRTTQTH